MKLFNKKKQENNNNTRYAILDGQDTQDSLIHSITRNEERTTAAVIGKDEIRNARKTLEEYKAGKENLEARIIRNEQWWKGRHWGQIGGRLNVENNTGIETADYEIKPTSAWLFNCIESKHADYVDAYPEPNILPREEGDKEEAKILTEIIKVILEQNGFFKVYFKESLKKLKDGSGVYGVFWDGQKLNGLGDISIKNIDFLNLFWMPGVEDIQDSPNVFHINLVPNEQLEESYPQLKGKLSGRNEIKAEYLYDDSIETKDKTAVIDWYYKKNVNGKKVLHFCKFCNDEVLFATENEVQRPTETVTETDYDAVTGEPFEHKFQSETGEESLAERGWYDHGDYPFIFDTPFPVEGSLCGFSLLDVCKEPQKYIDLIEQGVITNVLMNSRPRYFERINGNINEKEFLDWRKPIVHVNGDLSDLAVRKIDAPTLDGSAMAKIQDKIAEMKETTGNTDVSLGSTPAGVTAGSAIAALQESAGKTSRTQNKMAYQAYSEVITMVIELIRQFYDVPRQFRIMGDDGTYEFKSYSNQNIKPLPQESDFDLEVGYRMPVFDVEVSAQKANPYSKNAQNELALTLYNAGVFNPQNGDVALSLLETMDFNHKEDVMNKVEGNATLFEENQALKQQVVKLAASINPELAQQFAMQFDAGQALDPQLAINNVDANLEEETAADMGQNRQAAERARASTQV